MLIVDLTATHAERFLNHGFVILCILDERPFALLVTVPFLASCFVASRISCDGMFGSRGSHPSDRFFQLLDVFKLVVCFALLTILLLKFIIFGLVVVFLLRTLLVSVVVSTLVKGFFLGHDLILSKSIKLLIVIVFSLLLVDQSDLLAMRLLNSFLLGLLRTGCLAAWSCLLGREDVVSHVNFL